MWTGLPKVQEATGGEKCFGDDSLRDNRNKSFGLLFRSHSLEVNSRLILASTSKYAAHCVATCSSKHRADCKSRTAKYLWCAAGLGEVEVGRAV